jgi:hypothetical protein
MKKQRRRRVVSEHQVAFQRTLVYLAAIRPGVPIPVTFIANVVSGDMMLEGPAHATIAEMLAVAPFLVHAGLDQIVHLTTQDVGRDVVTVTEAQLPALRRALQELGGDQSRVAEIGLHAPEVAFTTELQMVAAFNQDDLARDHLALLAAHGLYWLEQALTEQDAEGAHHTIALFDALWLLYEQEALALSELAPHIPAVVTQVELHASGWNEWLPFSTLAAVGEALAGSGEADIVPWGERVFTLCERLIEHLGKQNKKLVRTQLKRARAHTRV